MADGNDVATRRPAHFPPDAAPSEVLWQRCEAALDGSRITVLSQDLDGRYVWVFNPPPELEPRSLIGRTDWEIRYPDEAGRFAEARQAVLVDGEPREFELEVPRPSAPRWFDIRIRPQRDASGAVVGTVASAIDITDRKVQEEHLRIVLRELAHRSKNLLAVIQGIARQTADSAVTTQEFLHRFNGRVYSLSRAHDVLTEADWRGARIFDLVRSQIALYAESRLASVRLEGENGFLRPNAAQYVGLGLHELTTNAIKYGALSVPDGTVAVRFDKSAADPAVYRFSWREESSVAVREPSGRSFGLLMLAEVVPTSVSGTAELHFAPEGLSYRLDIPKAQLVP